ncbi:hypothetical protein SBOR_0405 [Sclerotinia borealis F-4128]|uniref:Alcohol acetyltransferase n=1 Tax=Sclerotinia borealis (strain F-4128) TaxID=1432307 RepID=W9CST3_SCLBF|nr:hypothetical protein SBOR_0405 [Sclerotinia borealis F-4128]
MENDTFPAGLLGTSYSARHEYGLYRSCAVTSYYTFTPIQPTQPINPIQELTPRLSRALTQTIEKHPSLCYGLLPASKPRALPARFKRLSQICWEDIVSISSSSETTFSHTQEPAQAQAQAQAQLSTLETRISEEVASAHEQLFQDQETTPAWKLRVLIYGMGQGDATYRVYIVFLANHAIADGLSCAAFQRTLHEQLCLAATTETLETSASASAWPYVVPATVGKPIAIEDAMDISPPGFETFDIDIHPPSPSEHEKETLIWTGNFPCMPTIESYTSLMLLITVPAERVARILEISRRLKITVTGYLHGLIISYLARTTVTDDQFGLKAGTPYSLRKYSQLPLGDMANHVSSITSEWDAELLQRMRRTKEESLEEEELITEIGRKVSQQISSELKKIEEGGGVPLHRKVKSIVDLDTYCREGLLAARSETYELSNLGVIRMNKVPEKEEKSLILDGLIFSQCGMVLGPPIGYTAVNLEGGPLVVSLTWQKGGVEDDVMGGLQLFLKDRLGV